MLQPSRSLLFAMLILPAVALAAPGENDGGRDVKNDQTAAEEAKRLAQQEAEAAERQAKAEAEAAKLRAAAAKEREKLKRKCAELRGPITSSSILLTKGRRDLPCYAEANDGPQLKFRGVGYGSSRDEARTRATTACREAAALVGEDPKLCNRRDSGCPGHKKPAKKTETGGGGGASSSRSGSGNAKPKASDSKCSGNACDVVQVRVLGPFDPKAPPRVRIKNRSEDDVEVKIFWGGAFGVGGSTKYVVEGGEKTTIEGPPQYLGMARYEASKS